MDDTDNHMEREEAADDVPCDDTELEPALGWTEPEARWGRHAWSDFIDAELDECDDEESDPGEDNGDREPDVDDEEDGTSKPPLGWNAEEAARGRYPSQMGHRAEFEEGAAS